jgi:hypothetical protein
MTRILLSSATMSMRIRIQNVCTPEDGVIHIPEPGSIDFLPIRPKKRLSELSATAILSPTAVALPSIENTTDFIAPDP